ncbi:MAG: heavy metal translocating P-type ATPase, partial [Clostridiaceae bacterium]|nr:heavy metal translocating P-type ATPase [Clostridiaceae bacterium]
MKTEFILKGLGCANCANKIETQCKKIDGVLDASVNFVNKKLVIQSEDNEKITNIINEIKKIVKRIEPNVSVIENSVNGSKHEGNGHNHSHEEEVDNKNKIIRFSIGVVFFTIAIIFKLDYLVEFALFFISYLLIGGPVLLVAGRNILRGQVFDENFLMVLATVGAFSIGQFAEGVGVMLFYQVGEFFQDIAVNKSRKSITALMDIRPDYANKKVNGEIRKVDPEEVQIGDIIIVKPGEKVPLDGTVIEGKSLLDTAALTGESVPRGVKTGDEILAGCINKNGLLTIEVNKEFGQSTLAKILDLVQNASNKKAPTENFITKFARYYTPIVVISATAVAII